MGIFIKKNGSGEETHRIQWKNLKQKVKRAKKKNVISSVEAGDSVV